MSDQQPAGAAAVSGGACGYYTNVALLGAPASLRGCGQTIPPGNERSASPSVTLPPGGSTIPVTEVDRDGALAQYGPAVLFSGRPQPGGGPPTSPSGTIRVSTRGKRSITSSASVDNVGAGPFLAGSVRATCKASKSGTSASVRITRGVLVTATDADGNPTAQESIPSQPDANFALEGVNSVGDRFRAVFNEQTVDADGAITVNAVHLYLLGPNATGDVVIAQAHARA